jgi:hypothetical protein
MKVTDPKYSFKIVGKQFHTRGEVFRIDIDGYITGILYTHHALERIKQLNNVALLNFQLSDYLSYKTNGVTDARRSCYENGINLSS